MMQQPQAMQGTMMMPAKVGNPVVALRPRRTWQAPLGCCQCCGLSQCWFWSLWWMFGFGVVASLLLVYALFQWSDCDKFWGHSTSHSSTISAIQDNCNRLGFFAFFGSMGLYGLGGLFFLVLPFACCCNCLKAKPIPREERKDDRCCAPCKRTVSPAFWTTLGWAFLLIISGGALEAVGLLALDDQQLLSYDTPFSFSHAQVSTSDYTSMSWFALMWRIGAIMATFGCLLLLFSLSACCKCCTSCRMQPQELEAWFDEEDEQLVYPQAGYGIAMTQYPITAQHYGSPARVAPAPYGGGANEYNTNNNYYNKPAEFVTPEQVVNNSTPTYYQQPVAVKPMAAPIVMPTPIQQPVVQPNSPISPTSISPTSGGKDIDLSPSLHPLLSVTMFDQLQQVMDRLVVAGYADKLRAEQSLEADECRLGIITGVQTLHALQRNHRLELQNDLRAAKKLDLKAGLEVVRLTGVKNTNPSTQSAENNVVSAFLSSPSLKDSRVCYIQGVQVRSRLAALALLQGPLCLPGQEVVVEVEPIDQQSSNGRQQLRFVMEPAISSAMDTGVSSASMDFESAKHSYDQVKSRLERLEQLALEAERMDTPPLRLAVQRGEEEGAPYEAPTSDTPMNESDEESN